VLRKFISTLKTSPQVKSLRALRLAYARRIVPSVKLNKAQQRERYKMTPEMVMKTSHEPVYAELSQFKFKRDEVYTTPACGKIAMPRHGQEGYRVVGDANVPATQKVVFWNRDGYNSWITMTKREEIRLARRNDWLVSRATAECQARQRKRDCLGLENQSPFAGYAPG
jgi:hypothetical protein